MVTFQVLLILINSDFPVSTAYDHQYYPVVCYAEDQYYVFWEDRRYVSSDALYSVFCTRVTTDGTVLDPDGKLLFTNAVHYDIDAAFDGTSFLVAFEDSC